MDFFADKKALAAINAYPVGVRGEVLKLRELIIETAKECQCTSLQETLKWQQPSYITPKGSTIRIAGVDHEHYALYVHCQTSLVETYRELYAQTFQYKGNRALEFAIGEDVAISALKHCISLALRYHTVKHLPLLGA